MKMKKNIIIDTHSHVYLPHFDRDLNDVIIRSNKINIKKIITPAIDSSNYQRMMFLHKKYPDLCLPMIGVHPVSINSDNIQKELNFVKKKLKLNNFIGIGEIGIDLLKNKKFYKYQINAFCQQIKWAIEYNLPIVIHSRMSLDKIIKIFKNMQINYIKGIFHCFCGNLYEANKIIDFGLKLGIGGIITFNNNFLFLKEINITNIVLETDSPYLSPNPFRGKRNEPFFIKYVLKKLSTIYCMSENDISDITTNNVMKIFNFTF